jgi:hypothetical protein
MNFILEFTIVIPQLPCLFGMAKTVLLTVELLDQGTSITVHQSEFEMLTFASKGFPVDYIPWAEWWQ